MSLKQFIPAIKYGYGLSPDEMDVSGATNGYVVKYNSGTGEAEWAPESASPGTITLAEGSILVGNNLGVAAAVAAETDGQILIGDGTTINSVAVTGDITIDNAGLTAVASIDLETATITNIASTEIMIGTGAGTAVFAAVSGAITMDNAGVTTLTPIVNADVDAAAAIDFSKLAALPSAEILVGSAGNVATAVAMSGEVAIDNTGATTIGSINLETATVTGITDGEIMVGTAVAGVAAFVAVTGDVSLSNAGVTALVAADLETATLTNIADTEILIGTGAGTGAYAALSGDVTMANTGVTTIGAIDLETATVTNIADTEIMIGDGAGSAVFASISNDATLANTGALTVLKASTTWLTPSTTTSTGAGAVAITGSIHEITTTGTGDALTLADGTEGQHLHIVYVAEGAGADTAIVTPTNLAGAATTITFNALGDSAHIIFTAGAWYFLGGAAVVA